MDRDFSRVVLTGFMGTGKTTVGRLLADRLGWRFVDTDAVIESRHGAIPDIFATRGEAAFRSFERDVAAELAREHDLVIATGGRLMLDPDNAAALEAGGRVFCLTAQPQEILRRVAGEDGSERPLLAVVDRRNRIIDLLAERSAGYARFEQIRTDDRPPEEVVDEILGHLGEGSARFHE